MKRLLLTLVAMTMLLTQGAFAQEPAFTKTGKTVLLYSDGTWQYLDSIIFKARPLDIAKLEIPKTLPKDEVIAHAGYSLLYNEAHEQASWVAYELTAKETKKIYDRTDRFLVDPKVKKGSANDKDYQGSGYDRGHLAPAADMTWSIESITESFYYSNMSPQVPYFNRVIWKALEERVRSWAVENDALYIVTGPVLRKGLPTIGANRVSIPEYYYKVILDYRDPVVKGIGFIMPNMTSTVPLQAYAVSIDSVEVLTGLDFFPSLV
jgi:endonuclease G